MIQHPINNEETQILIDLLKIKKNRMQNHYYKEKYHLKYKKKKENYLK